MNKTGYGQVFHRLQSFYILITIHNLEEHSLPQLEALAHRLEGELSLSPPLQKINQRLAQQSQENLQEKKRRKQQKKKVSQSLSQTNNTMNQSSQHVLDDLNSTGISLKDQKWGGKYNVNSIFDGIIYDGKMFFTLNVTTKQMAKDGIQVGFIVCGQKKSSSVPRHIVKNLGLVQKGNEPILLYIEGKPQLMIVTEQEESILGLSFLREHKVVITSNYRPQCSKCQLIFTE